MKPTLKSIAAELGVTHTTVSNAFNRPDKISEKLRESILEHARSVGYYGPNQAAKSLRTGKCSSIGVIFNDQLSYAFTDPYDILFLHGISTVCEQHALNMVLIPLKTQSQDQNHALTNMVDGYILNAPYKNNPTTREALSKGLPVTVVDFDDPNHVSINNDEANLMSEITERLVKLGHKKIAIITFGMYEEEQNFYHLDFDIGNDNFVVSQRLLGCQQTLKKHGIALETILVKETENSSEGGAKAAEFIFKENPDVTAFICFSDVLAYGVMQYCEQKNLSIPKDISVTGFDGIKKPEFALHLPSLTTIKQNPFRKGQKAIQALLDQIDNKGKSITLDAEFVIGESTTEAPKR